jgi:hypothetical protein
MLKLCKTKHIKGLESMGCVWWEADNNDIMSGSIVKEFIGEVGGVTINNEKVSAAIGNILGLRVKDSLHPLLANDL